MKVSIAFKQAIENYLKERALNDSLFAETLSKENKNINDCITYILNRVKSSGINGFSDHEIFSMAVHYYDEDDIKVGSPMKCKVVVNHTVELTPEEKEKAKKQAYQQIMDDEYKRLHKKSSKVASNNSSQKTLF